MVDFPGSLDSFVDPTALNNQGSPSHSSQHADANNAIEAVEAKLGIGATTPSSGAVLVGNGAGSSVWDSSPVLTLDTPTLNTPDLNGTELILDADADTSITADTDDQIDIRIAGADDFRLVANIFRALSGSTIETNTINETTAASGVTIDSVIVKDGGLTVTSHIDVNDSSTAIRDSSDNELVKFTKAATAVNELTIGNAATTVDPYLEATGDDSDIGVNIKTKGTEYVRKNGNPIDWWEEIGSTTLGSAGDTIAVSFAARKYLWIKINIADTGGTINGLLTFNSDTANNYARRFSNDNAADTTTTSSASIVATANTLAAPMTSDLWVDNVAAREKLVRGVCYSRGAAGAANAPARMDGGGKWANTASQITSLTLTNGGAGDYAIGSEVKVLGHD